jgi:aryl-alcohol dehydrogenase-like predicted oxidoreductase
MRLPADEHAAETIGAAARAGIALFDTARAYGDNERLLADALRRCGAGGARVVTKGGMARPDGAWVPDGRAKSILADCEASLAALGGLPIDLYLLHAPDPRTPWATSVRALARLAEEGLVRHVGLSNVNRRQLDEALELAPVTAVQVALSPHDDRALRGGVVECCAAAGITVMAHSPLGGPRRAAALARNAVVADVAAAHGATPGEVVLAWLLALSPAIVPIPGARRPETAVSAARAASLRLEDAEREALAGAFGRPEHSRPQRRAVDGEVVVVMGIPGAGKSRLAETYVARSYVRLNRDERGGTLRGLADDLAAELAGGTRRVVLDNTYLTRAARNYVLETAARHGLRTRCVWLDTPLGQAQVNLVGRLLDRLGRLPEPDELRALARREPGILSPTSQMRAARELEPPSADEGWAAVERVEFERSPLPHADTTAVLVAAAAVGRFDAPEPPAPHLVFDWSPDGARDALDSAVADVEARVSGPVEGALCRHPAGPPSCWCRPPLPGLPLAFLRAHGVDPARATLVGTGPAHRTLAAALGARYVPVAATR